MISVMLEEKKDKEKLVRATVTVPESVMKFSLSAARPKYMAASTRGEKVNLSAYVSDAMVHYGKVLVPKKKKVF